MVSERVGDPRDAQMRSSDVCSALKSMKCSTGAELVTSS